MTNFRALNALAYLYRIAEAGERGYAVAAANVNNRGLKLLLKSYAQQRENFKKEIFAEMERLGSTTWPRSSIRGMIHRGRIDIFAALTIGDENRERVVLKEVAVGENAALRAYARALEADLPSETRDIVMWQHDQIRQVYAGIESMVGNAGKRQVVRLYDSEADAARAVRALTDAGFASERIDRTAVDMLSGSRKPLQLYEGRGTTIFETILSGAAGGALWGAVNGAVAAITILNMPDFGAVNFGSLTLTQFAGLTALSCVAGGAFVGSMIGTFIGWGVTSGDEYLTDEALKRGKVLVRVNADRAGASRAWRLLAEENREARMRAKDAERATLKKASR